MSHARLLSLAWLLSLASFVAVGVACTGGPLPDGGSSEDAGAATDAGTAASDAGEANDAGTAVDAGDTVDAGAGEPPLGTFDHPIVVDAFPFAFSGDTEVAPSDVADVYTPCAPETSEAGGEFVFRVEVPSGDADKTLVVAVDDVSGDGVDVDVHLLDAPSADSCLARDNVQLSSVVSPDDVLYVVADTWTNSAGVDLSGPFTLTLSLVDIDVEACFENPIPTCDETTFTTVNGVPTEPEGLGGCPAGMTLVDGFCIDRYEAMLVEVLPDDSLAPFSPYQNPGQTTVRAMSVPGAVPQGYISGTQAAAACANANKRLCTNTEWLRACQGAAGNTFPYGPTLQPGLCNDDRSCHPAIQYFESSADFVWSQLGHPCINQLPASVDETGQNAGCVSADGAYDMMGNLHEWTSDPNGTFRGGFYTDTEVNGPGCLYATTAHSTAHWDYSTGFRCCADAP